MSGTIFVRLQIPSAGEYNPPTTVYGYLSGNSVVEAFATNPVCCGCSEGRQGEIHPATDAKEISQAEFNACFLNLMDDEIKEDEKTMSLGALRERYPIEEGAVRAHDMEQIRAIATDEGYEAGAALKRIHNIAEDALGAAW